MQSPPVGPRHVWVSQSALRLILDETEDKWPLETGGMLLGYHGQDQPEIVITEALGPGPKARHGSHTFTPDGKWQQRHLAERYESSGRVTTFVGDWHSHPEGLPLPSPRDLKTARKVSRRKSARVPYPATLIVGTEDDRPGICMYVFDEAVLLPVPWEIFGD